MKTLHFDNCFQNLLKITRGLKSNRMKCIKDRFFQKMRNILEFDSLFSTKNRCILLSCLLTVKANHLRIRFHYSYTFRLRMTLWKWTNFKIWINGPETFNADEIIANSLMNISEFIYDWRYHLTKTIGLPWKREPSRRGDLITWMNTLIDTRDIWFFSKVV